MGNYACFSHDQGWLEELAQVLWGLLNICPNLVLLKIEEITALPHQGMG